MRLLVLPTQEDQANLAAGRVPENHFDVRFVTEAEAEAYVQGLSALNDLAEFEIVDETNLHLTVSIDGEPEEFVFETGAEKDAFKEGLEQGDGFVNPAVYWEGREGFPELAALLATPPTPI